MGGHEYPRHAVGTEARLTCPGWYAESPFYAHLSSMLRDYRAGALGDVRKLPAPLWDYLRVLANARDEWAKHWEEELMPQAPKGKTSAGNFHRTRGRG